MLPNLDGISILRELRSQKIQSRVIILSAKGDVEDRVSGLETGANDYLPKPFSMMELVARVRVLARESAHDLPTTLEIEGLVLDQNSKLAVF